MMPHVLYVLYPVVRIRSLPCHILRWQKEAARQLQQQCFRSHGCLCCCTREYLHRRLLASRYLLYTTHEQAHRIYGRGTTLYVR